MLYVDHILFFSLDLVNSTEYKTLNPKEWPTVFQKFYEIADNKLREKFSRIKVWKYIGDEVLYYLRINSLKDIFDAPVCFYEVLQESIASLHKHKPESKRILSIKATLWMAKVGKIPSLNQEEAENIFKHGNFQNIIISSENSFKTDIEDFLGPDIDTGFRISKYSFKGKLVISANIAYILYKFREEVYSNYKYAPEDRLRILYLKKLKGIWNGRAYPIIWYQTDWDYKKVFSYDDHLHTEYADFVKEILITKQTKLKVIQRISDEIGFNEVLDCSIKEIQENSKKIEEDEIKPISLPIKNTRNKYLEYRMKTE
ncbi:hypothetical protein [Leptospira noguchii]|uniref:hypothetical protein n=1 Tax=Leptospira noguchii TaxID=28182 RepID=UPI000773A76C|nr:hypothetical protein [Leptospira noguchii]